MPPSRTVYLRPYTPKTERTEAHATASLNLFPHPPTSVAVTPNSTHVSNSNTRSAWIQQQTRLKKAQFEEAYQQIEIATMTLTQATQAYMTLKKAQQHERKDVEAYHDMKIAKAQNDCTDICNSINEALVEFNKYKNSDPMLAEQARQKYLQYQRYKTIIDQQLEKYLNNKLEALDNYDFFARSSKIAAKKCQQQAQRALLDADKNLTILEKTDPTFRFKQSVAVTKLAKRQIFPQP